MSATTQPLPSTPAPAMPSNSPLPVSPRPGVNNGSLQEARVSHGRSGSALIWALVAIAVLSVVALAGWATKDRVLSIFTRNTQFVTAKVTRTDLPITVREHGDLESAQTIVVKCEIEGDPSKIVFLVDESTQVKKGDVVVRFDAEKMRRSLAEQEIKFNTADAKAKAAKEELDVQKNKGEGEIAKAELALKLAELDHDKYLDGEYKVEVDDKQGAINLAERELKEAQEKLEGFRIFVKKGFGTPEQLSLKELEVARALNNLDRDRAKLMVLQKYTKFRQEVELLAKAKDAKREVVRTKSSARATIAKAEADLEGALVVANLEKEQLERFQRQLAHAEVKAPADGIVVYSRTRFWDPATRVQLGGLISPQQPLFQLPALETMQVKVKIHESKIQKVQVGQKAEILVEAFAGLVLHGTVAKVATLADTESPWFNGGAKQYECVVKIDDLPTGAGLRPGFSAEVNIKANQLTSVLAVPVQAVAQREGKYVAYVRSGSHVERREVTVGENNDSFVEIRDGLEEGESVCLDARARSVAESQAGEGESKRTEPERKAPLSNPRIAR